jgi:hypothetical protein
MINIVSQNMMSFMNFATPRCAFQEKAQAKGRDTNYVCIIFHRWKEEMKTHRIVYHKFLKFIF